MTIVTKNLKINLYSYLRKHLEAINKVQGVYFYFSIIFFLKQMILFTSLKPIAV